MVNYTMAYAACQYIPLKIDKGTVQRLFQPDNRPFATYSCSCPLYNTVLCFQSAVLHFLTIFSEAAAHTVGFFRFFARIRYLSVSPPLTPASANPRFKIFTGVLFGDSCGCCHPDTADGDRYILCIAQPQRRLRKQVDEMCSRFGCGAFQRGQDFLFGAIKG